VNGVSPPDRERFEPGGAATTADQARGGDSDAVRAVRGGEVAAFGRLVERYQRRVFGLSLMLTRDPAAAEELAQDAFVRAFTHLDAYDAARPFYPWLATIAVRLSQNWLTQRARHESREGQPGAADAEAKGADPLTLLIADEESRRLWRWVAALPTGERAAAILYYRQELTVDDVARALGVSGGTVKTLLFRARRHLRRSVGGAGEAGDRT